MATIDLSKLVTADEKAAQARQSMLTGFRRAVQAHLDAKAQERQYDDAFTLATYVTSTNPDWLEEAQSFVAWRDEVWGYALGELDKVTAGEREVPTVEEFIAELPAFAWPL